MSTAATITFVDGLGRILASSTISDGLKPGERREISADVKQRGRIQEWISVTDSGDVLKGRVNGFAVYEGQRIRVTIAEVNP